MGELEYCRHPLPSFLSASEKPLEEKLLRHIGPQRLTGLGGWVAGPDRGYYSN